MDTPSELMELAVEAHEEHERFDTECLLCHREALESMNSAGYSGPFYSRDEMDALKADRELVRDEHLGRIVCE